MNNRKFKAMVEQRTKQTLQEWSLQSEIIEHEIYRFLHNLKGTAGTIGLCEIEQFAEDSLLFFQESSLKSWSTEAWESYLNPLISLLDKDDAADSEEVHSLEQSVSAANLLTQQEILLIDDDLELVAYLKESLEESNYYVSIALSAEQGLKIFYDSRPDLILLDIHLPDLSGMELLSQIIDKAKKELIPIMIISGEDSKATRLHAYRLGAMDFLIKPMDRDLFIELIKNRLQLKREWQEAIILDEMTGAFNRKHFNYVIQQLISDYKRTNRVFSLALIDLDCFKQMNDTYGHLLGDEVLQSFSDVVKNSIRSEDIFFRFGGDEFALLMPNTQAGSAVSVLKRIHERFAEVNFIHHSSENINLTFSCGISDVSAGANMADSLIEQADQALYASKRAGRNQTMIYSKQVLYKNHSILNVIIVDDDSLMRSIVTNKIASWEPRNVDKIKVSSYTNGLDFLQSDWYSSGEKYILLLDGIMPDLDGIEVLKRVRKSYPEENVLVIMLTGRNDQKDVIHALQLGADDYVVKPVRFAELTSRMERLAHRFLF